MPGLVLWAWQGTQDLRFLDGRKDVGIAYLDRTLKLGRATISELPRLEPLRYVPGTPLLAVVRIESPSSETTTGHAPSDAARLAARAVTGRRREDLRALQIDFDARQSERGWYREFMAALRAQIPATLPLSMTALESWCEEASPRAWTDGLPVAEAVPMLFRMGQGEQRSPVSFANSMCIGSTGVSTDEWPRRVPDGTRRLYIFHPGPWNAAAFERTLGDAQRWIR